MLCKFYLETDFFDLVHFCQFFFESHFDARNQFWAKTQVPVFQFSHDDFHLDPDVQDVVKFLFAMPRANFWTVCQ